MNPHRLPSRLLLILSACLLPLGAQTPLFTDGPAFGGSKVFSEGRNPQGNSARIDQAAPGWYMTYVDGSVRALDNKSILSDCLAPDAAAVAAALARLDKAPWALKTKGYGLAGIKDGASFAYTREEFNGVLASADLDPTRLGANLGLNGTTFMGRRVTVDRLSFGGGGSQNGTSFGGNLRMERWTRGSRTGALNPGGDQIPLASVENGLYTFTETQDKTLSYSMDLGYCIEVAQGLRLGVTVDQLNPKHLWDVYLRPQFRAGLQFDLGATTKLSVESDINAVERMPFPVKQQTSSASLRFSTSPEVAFLLGAERRKIGDATVTRGGITLQLRTAAVLIGIGIQIGQDSPLKGATLMVN